MTTMTTKNTDTCFLKAADDEPVFVLRAQDLFAAGLVETWADALERYVHHQPDLADARRAKIADARQTAAAMRAWPTRKIPD